LYVFVFLSLQSTVSYSRIGPIAAAVADAHLNHMKKENSGSSYTVSSLYRVGQKSKPHTFLYIFAKCFPIFKIFYRHILWKICNKEVIKYTTTP